MWLRNAVAPFLSASFSEQPQWDETSRSWAIEQIAPDAKRLLEFYRKRPDFWPEATRDLQADPPESR